MKLFRVLGFLFLLSFGSTIFFTQFVLPGDATSTSLTIESGMTVREVADVLKEHGVITSAMAFRWYVKNRGLDTGIQPGQVEIPRGAGFAEIAALLSEREGRQMRITIPEGFTIAQIDALLTEKGLIEAGAFAACTEEHCMEGYLFPDTYFVDPTEFDPMAFATRLRATFDARVMDELSDSDRSLDQIVIMASLIERETRTDEERPIVSGILWKRFDAGRGLDVDASVRYALGKETGPLTKSDLENPSPYNTRRHAGLPPGAIANPGLKSIRAALNPEESEYWYYLHGKDGQIRYAVTNEEHNVNKAKYL